jgi:hypothetical protein
MPEEFLIVINYEKAMSDVEKGGPKLCKYLEDKVEYSHPCRRPKILEDGTVDGSQP